MKNDKISAQVDR